MKALLAAILLGASAACATTPSASLSPVSASSVTPVHSSASTLGGLTPSQRALALRVAQRVGWGSRPSSPGTFPSGIDPSAPGSWPANVEKVSVIVTSHAAALKFAGGGTEPGNASLSVLVIRLVGEFSWVTTGPPGHGNATGNVATIVVDATTGQVTDTGLEQGDPNAALPAESVVYARGSGTTPGIGHKWRLTQVTADGKTSTIPDSITATVQLTADGQFLADDSVNAVSGRWVSTPSGYRVSSSGTTLVAYAGTDSTKLEAIGAIDSVTVAEANVTAHSAGTALTLAVPKYTLTFTDAGAAATFPPPSPTTTMTPS